jgi:cold shock CspA family protein
MNPKSPLKGLVREWFEERSFGSILADADGKSYLVLRKSVQPDDAGRQFLIVNEPVQFSVAPTRTDQAVDVVPEFRESIPTEHETVTAHTWNGTFGWARREYGGDLFFHRSDIITSGEDTLKQGSKLLVIAAPPSRSTDKLWVATQIEIFQPEEVKS